MQDLLSHNGWGALGHWTKVAGTLHDGRSSVQLGDIATKQSEGST